LEDAASVVVDGVLAEREAWRATPFSAMSGRSWPAMFDGADTKASRCRRAIGDRLKAPSAVDGREGFPFKA
jgi:hypothetical protein